MIGADITQVVQTIGGVLFGLGAMVLAIPAYRISRSQERHAKTAQIAESVGKLLGIPASGEVADRTPENPSMIDLLADMRAQASAQTATANLLSHHMSDGHGLGPADRKKNTQ